MKHRKKAQFRTKPELSLLQFDHLTLNWFFFIHKISGPETVCKFIEAAIVFGPLVQLQKIFGHRIIVLGREKHAAFAADKPAGRKPPDGLACRFMPAAAHAGREEFVPGLVENISGRYHKADLHSISFIRSIYALL